MKKGTGILLIVSVLILITLIVFVKSYRRLSTLNEEVKNKEININVQLSRKKEQVSNLIEISKKYIKNEDTLLNELEMNNNSLEIVDKYIAREKASINERIIELLNELFSKFNDKMLNDEELRSAINGIVSTEKRIDVAANNYNKAILEYNSEIKKFPSSILSFFRGFKRIDMFVVSVKLNNILETK